MLQSVLPFDPWVKNTCFERLIPVMEIDKVTMLLSQNVPETTDGVEARFSSNSSNFIRKLTQRNRNDKIYSIGTMTREVFYWTSDSKDQDSEKLMS